MVSMDQLTPIGFLDVPVLLEASQPQPRIPWIWYGIGSCVGLMIAAAFMSPGGAKGSAIQVLASVMSVVIFLSLPMLMRFKLRRIREEQQAVSSAGELLHLRRWAEAANLLQQILSRPARTLPLRSEALLYLASVLNRYHRFEDAITIQNHLLDEELVSPSTAYGLKLSRTMGMLRQDHLFDADGAISDLRRISPPDSAGFALVEMYRDVKTGHPEEALRIFDGKLQALRSQLGHRLADAYALAARAYDLLDRRDEAANAFRRATLLAPLIELCRRYPEVEKLLGRYEPAAAPSEMA
jgi:tetratricopeptide (TPR) repeat protein